MKGKQVKVDFLSFMEFVGTVAFAATGALVAIEKDLDYYGISFLAIVTAIGGGIVRDMMIDRQIPASLENPIYAIISIITVIVVIVFYNHIHHLEKLINLCDAFGLAAFTSIGAAAATKAGFDQVFIVMTMAAITGTGGGLIRDVCIREVPFIFEKEVYAVASLMGGLVYFISHEFFSVTRSMYIAFSITLGIRLLSMKLNIHLRKVKKKNKL